MRLKKGIRMYRLPKGVDHLSCVAIIVNRIRYCSTHVSLEDYENIRKHSNTPIDLQGIPCYHTMHDRELLIFPAPAKAYYCEIEILIRKIL